MKKLLATKKTDLLQFVSSRTRRPFSAYLVVQKDGKVGFEFEAKDPSKARAGRGRPGAALRVLGAHPKTKAPVELHAGRYGPYVKHGDVNATLPDRDQMESITLDDALALLAAKSGKSGGTATRPARGAAKKTSSRATAAKKAAEPTGGQARPGTQDDQQDCCSEATRRRRARPQRARASLRARRPRRRPRRPSRPAGARRADACRPSSPRPHSCCTVRPAPGARRPTRLCRTARVLRACGRQRGLGAARHRRGPRFGRSHVQRDPAVLAAPLASRRLPVLRALRLPDRPHVVAGAAPGVSRLRVAPRAARLSRRSCWRSRHRSSSRSRRKPGGRPMCPDSSRICCS